MYSDGAGISAGIEAAPRRLQLLHEHDPSLCTWSKDCMNAFQTLDRHVIRDCLREHDPRGMTPSYTLSSARTTRTLDVDGTETQMDQ